MKMVPFESLGTVSYSRSITTMAVSLAVSTQYTNVTDARQTPHDGIGCAYEYYRAEKSLGKSRLHIYRLPKGISNAVDLYAVITPYDYRSGTQRTAIS